MSRTQSLSMKHRTNNITTSAKTGRWAWFTLPPVQWSFRPSIDRNSFIEAGAGAYASLIGHQIKIRVTHRPFPVEEWARGVNAAFPDALPGWAPHLVSQQKHLMGKTLSRKEVYLGVNLLEKPIRRVAVREEIHRITSIAAGPGLDGRPASPADLDWLLHRSAALGHPAPLTLPPSVPVWDEEDFDLVSDRVDWNVWPGDRSVRVWADIDGKAHVRHVVILTLGPMQKLPRTMGPWMQKADRLPFPVEWSITADIPDRDKVRKWVRDAGASVKAQMKSWAEHEEEPPAQLSRQLAQSIEVEDEVTGTNPLTTRMWGWVRAAVSGPTEEVALERAEAFANLYLPLLPFTRARPIGDGQYDLARGFIPGEPEGGTGHLRRVPVTTFAAAVPAASSVIGDQVGFHLGSTDGDTQVASSWHPWAAMERRERSGTTVVSGGLGSGKALALDTPLPTPDGWTSMGEVKVGDILMGADGKPTPVVAVTDVMHGRPCYEVSFSDGTTIVADAQHQWLTSSLYARKSEIRTLNRADKPLTGRDQRHKKVLPSVVTTEHMADTLYSTNAAPQINHAVKVASGFDLPEIDLPIQPYTLGVWLGDGHSDSASLQATLREHGLLGNKHIPAAYLRAGENQRRALLSGLLDTDGYCTPSGAVEFAVTDESLARGTYELVISLGYKATLRRKPCPNGRPGRQTAFTVAFTPSDTVFWLSRKAARQNPTTGRGITARRMGSSTRQYRYVTKVERVDSVPVRCVQVAAADHLFLASRACIPTHNSTLLGILMYWSALANVRTRGLDPSGPLAEMCYLPELRDVSQAIDLMDADPGALNPFAVIANPERENHLAKREEGMSDEQWEVQCELKYRRAISSTQELRKMFCTDILMALLPKSISSKDSTFEAISTAMLKIQGYQRSSPREVLRELDQSSGDAGKFIANTLRGMAELPQVALIFPPENEREIFDTLRNDSVLQILTMRGNVTPEDKKPPEDWTIEERIGIPLLTLAARLTNRHVYVGSRHVRKLTCFDEVHEMTKIAAGRSTVSSGARDTRKFNNRLVLASQDAEGALVAGLANWLDNGFVGRTEGKRAQTTALEQVLKVQVGVGYEKTLATLSPRVSQTSARTGYRQFIWNDGDGAIERVRIDIPQALRKVLDTTPDPTRAYRELSLVKAEAV